MMNLYICKKTQCKLLNKFKNAVANRGRPETG